MRLKEHRDAWETGMPEKLAVGEHAQENHHPIHWEETTVLDPGRGQELLVKEALHIQMTPSEERFSQDGEMNRSRYRVTQANPVSQEQQPVEHNYALSF